MGLISFFPTSGYLTLDLYWYVSLIHAVQNGVHAFDHRLFQANLCVRCPLYIALDGYLVVAHEDRRSPRTLASTLPRESQGQLQAVRPCALDRRVSKCTSGNCFVGPSNRVAGWLFR